MFLYGKIQVTLINLTGHNSHDIARLRQYGIVEFNIPLDTFRRWAVWYSRDTLQVMSEMFQAPPSDLKALYKSVIIIISIIIVGAEFIQL